VAGQKVSVLRHPDQSLLISTPNETRNRFSTTAEYLYVISPITGN
jgi:hypothetical protein